MKCGGRGAGAGVDGFGLLGVLEDMDPKDRTRAQRTSPSGEVLSPLNLHPLHLNLVSPDGHGDNR